jgi:hypothetical protein
VLTKRFWRSPPPFNGRIRFRRQLGLARNETLSVQF